MFDGVDACGTTVWNIIDVEVGGSDRHTEETLFYPITGLTPFTRYAVYIKTYMVRGGQTGGVTDILYFTTKPSRKLMFT